MKTVINSSAPIRLQIILDTNEIYPDDPGNGCPVLVATQDFKYTASWNCATNEGELDCGSYPLSDRQMNWLESKSQEVYDWMSEHHV